jgi:hypothetical protein
MNREPNDDSYEKWRARRAADFQQVDLTYLVMASVRSLDASSKTEAARAGSYFDLPSRFLGIARVALVLFLILTPA